MADESPTEKVGNRPSALKGNLHGNDTGDYTDNYTDSFMDSFMDSQGEFTWQ